MLKGQSVELKVVASLLSLERVSSMTLQILTPTNVSSENKNFQCCGRRMIQDLPSIYVRTILDIFNAKVEKEQENCGITESRILYDIISDRGKHNKFYHLTNMFPLSKNPQEKMVRCINFNRIDHVLKEMNSQEIQREYLPCKYNHTVHFGHRLIWGSQSEPAVPVDTKSRLSFHTSEGKAYLTALPQPRGEVAKLYSVTPRLAFCRYGHNYQETSTRGLIANNPAGSTSSRNSSGVHDLRRPCRFPWYQVTSGEVS